jgi:DNA processing protein
MTIYDLALSFTPALGNKGVAHLIDIFRDAEGVFRASESDLRGLAGIQNTKLLADIRAQVGMRAAEREMEYCERNHIYAIAATDKVYPPLLAECADRPHILFAQGSLAPLTAPMVAFVGTRGISTYGQVIGRKLVEQLHSLKGDVCIASGLAFGNDENAHKAALEVGAKTVAVIANALPEVTPAGNRNLADRILSDGGTIVTEISSQHKNTGRFFPSRNRIIAALASGTVVVESPYEGGSLITAEYALGYGRTVMAVPGRAFDKNSYGSNLLIKHNKAAMVCSGGDILYELGWDVVAEENETFAPTLHPTETLHLQPDEEQLLKAMTTGEVVEYEILVGRTGFAPARVVALLTSLELCDAVRILPGRKCERIL